MCASNVKLNSTLAWSALMILRIQMFLTLIGHLAGLPSSESPPSNADLESRFHDILDIESLRWHRRRRRKRFLNSKFHSPPRDLQKIVHVMPRSTRDCDYMTPLGPPTFFPRLGTRNCLFGVSGSRVRIQSGGIMRIIRIGIGAVKRG